MRRNRRVIVLSVIITALLACQTAPAPVATRTGGVATATAAAAAHTSEPRAATASPDTPVPATPVPEPGALSWIFDLPAEPIQVDVILETGSTVTATIQLEGGTLSATGADGTLYTLDIPPDALLAATTIGMTPVGSLAGMPYGGEQTYAVQFSPDGLSFHKDAILTITPAEAIPLEEQLVFGYEADGRDPILATPVVDSGEIKILVQHFSGNGVTRGLLADLAPARERVGASAERRLENAANAEFVRQRQRMMSGTAASLEEWIANAAALEAVLEQYEREVVQPRVEAAGESCAAGLVAIETVHRLARLRVLMIVSGLINESDGYADDPLDRYPGLRDKTTKTCVVEEFELCVEEHVIHRMLPVWKGFERQYLLSGAGGTADHAVLREARELTTACLTFELQFESTGVLKDAGGGGYESEVTSEIMLRFDADELLIKGEAPLINEDFEFELPGSCDVTSVPGGGMFEVFKLIVLDVPDGGYGHVSDFTLMYLPGPTSESASYTCTFPGGGQTAGQMPPFPAWTSTFLATHEGELVADSSVTEGAESSLGDTPPGGGFRATEWEIFGDEYFAKKEWIKESGHIIERGTFKLYHNPKP